MTTPKEPGKRPSLWLTGRIGECVQVGNTRENFPILETILLLPAPDNYTSPKRLCIRSNSKLGNQGEDVTIEVEPVLRSWLDKKKQWQHPHHLVAVKP